MSTRWMNSRAIVLALSAGGSCGLQEESRGEGCKLRSVGDDPSTAPIPRLRTRGASKNSRAERLLRNFGEFKTVTKFSS